jgi:hypothetical protein
MIDAFFTSGHVADLVFAVMAIEALVIFILMRRGRINLPFRTYVFGVIAGGFIVLGLRFALTDASNAMIGLALALSFVAHIGELFSFLQHNGNLNHRVTSYNSRSIEGTTTKKDPRQ